MGQGALGVRAIGPIGLGVCYHGGEDRWGLRHGGLQRTACGGLACGFDPFRRQTKVQDSSVQFMSND